MSKEKIHSAESTDDEQTNEASDPLQQDDKSATLVIYNDISLQLQDLPNEMLVQILVQAVVVEVLEMKLVKSVWKGKADLVMEKFGSVCERWSNIFEVELFRRRIYRLLDGTEAREFFRLEVVHRSTVSVFHLRLATMKDEVFVLCLAAHPHIYVINVHDRKNMEEVKDVIRLPSGMRPVQMVGCSVSNCVYVLDQESKCFSILRITKDEEQQFNISPWIKEPSLSLAKLRQTPTPVRLFVSVKGNLLVLNEQREMEPNPFTVRTYSSHGVLQRAVALSSDLFQWINRSSRLLRSRPIRPSVIDINQKSNGNILLATFDDFSSGYLMEVDANGSRVRHYCSPTSYGANVADSEGRIWMTDMGKTFELLDSEFNALFYLQYPHVSICPFEEKAETHYNSERNEYVQLCKAEGDSFDKIITIFRFIEI